MHDSRPLDFEHTDRRRVYEVIERHGTIDRARVEDELAMDPAGARHHVAILKRDGRIDEEDGELRVAIDIGAIEERDAEGLEYRIRPAVQEDLAGLVGVMREVVSAGTYVEAESVAQLIDREEVVLRFNSHESRMVFVATVHDDVIGWVHLQRSAIEKLSHTATLTVGIVEEYRNRGIGSHLLWRGLEWAASNDVERVYQSVPATNERAIEFLESHGWTVEAVRRGHYRIDGEDVDEVMMAITP